MNGVEGGMEQASAAIILAGGEGQRLRALTRLARTRRRAGHLIPSERTLFCLTRAHEPFYGPALADVAPSRLVVQPQNRGVDFSHQVLERRPEMLAVLPVHGVGWRDLGEPKRVAATRRELQWQAAPA